MIYFIIHDFPQVPYDVPVRGTAEIRFVYKPPYAGRATFAAKFSSKELDDVDGFKAFVIAPRDEDILMSDRSNNETIFRTDIVG